MSDELKRLRAEKFAEVIGNDETAARVMRELAGRRIPKLPETFERNREIREALKCPGGGPTYKQMGEVHGMTRQGAFRAANPAKK